MGILRKVRIFLCLLARALPCNFLRCLVYRLGGVSIGAGAKIGWGVPLAPGTRAGARCIVRPGAEIGQGVELGADVTVGAHSCLIYSIIGNRSFVERGAVVMGAQGSPIQIGSNSYVGMTAALEGFGGLRIGNNVHIAGPSVSMWTHSSVFECLRGDELTDHSHRKLAPINIADNVWIGGKATVYPGVSIGHHSVVLPNSVVDADVAAYSVVGGVPAVLLREIKANEDMSEFLFQKSRSGETKTEAQK